MNKKLTDTKKTTTIFYLQEYVSLEEQIALKIWYDGNPAHLVFKKIDLYWEEDDGYYYSCGNVSYNISRTDKDRYLVTLRELQEDDRITISTYHEISDESTDLPRNALFVKIKQSIEREGCMRMQPPHNVYNTEFEEDGGGDFEEYKKKRASVEKALGFVKKERK